MSTLTTLYRYVGTSDPGGPYLNGVPQADLSIEDFRALEPSAQSAVVMHTEMYQRLSEAEQAPAADQGGGGAPAQPEGPTPPQAEADASPAVTVTGSKGKTNAAG